MEFKPYIKPNQTPTEDIKAFLLSAAIEDLRQRAGFIPPVDLTPLPLYHFFRRYEKYNLVRIIEPTYKAPFEYTDEWELLHHDWKEWLKQFGFSIYQRAKIYDYIRIWIEGGTCNDDSE